MSLFNGDKARSHRRRKQNIQRRIRTHALVQAQTAKGKKSSSQKSEKS